MSHEKPLTWIDILKLSPKPAPPSHQECWHCQEPIPDEEQGGDWSCPNCSYPWKPAHD